MKVCRMVSCRNWE